jgi:hypothetical protein
VDLLKRKTFNYVNTIWIILTTFCIHLIFLTLKNEHVSVVKIFFNIEKKNININQKVNACI